jgi:ribonuclease BN (tRNA processing enzyme)
VVEHQGFTVLLDPGYATLPRLQRRWAVGQVDAVVITHGHPDHCADLNPLLRARAYGVEDHPILPVHAPARALDAVLALDDFYRVGAAAEVVTVTDGHQERLGPFTVEYAALPHHVTNLGVRLTTSAGTVAYTGDSGPDPAVVELGRGADVFLIEATHLEPITDSDRLYLCDVRTAIRQGLDADARMLLLTHLWPTLREADVRKITRHAEGPVDVRVADADVEVAVERA